MDQRVPVASSAEADLVDLYEHAPCGLLSMDMDGVILSANLTFVRWSGRQVEELIGRQFSSLLALGSQAFYETRCLPILLLEHELREVLLEMDRPGLDALPILMNADVVVDEHSRPRMLRVAVFDASARHDYERELLSARRAAERSEARVRVLQHATVTLGAEHTASGVAAALSSIARSASDAAAATVMLVDDVGAQLEAASPVPTPLPDVVRINAHRPEAEAFRLGETVSISSIGEMERRYPELADDVHAARLEAMMVTPMLEDDSCLGVLVSLYGRRRTFPPEQIELHMSLARQAAQAICRVQLELQLRQMALHDKLTGLANRDSLDSQLTESSRASEQSGLPMSLMFLDLDGFKPINDQLGHAAGDRVLIEIARRLRSAVREGDVIARIGGDEFAIVCEDCHRHDAERLSERIHSAIRQPLDGIREDQSVTASIGVVCLPGGRRADGDALLRRADAAMYRSKAGGTNRTTVVDA